MPLHNSTQVSDDRFDSDVDLEISTCLSIDCPRSFFLFAGAGSGKTRSLVNALQSIRATSGPRLLLTGRQIGVITYTNAACQEIIRRIDYDPIFFVHTIHSFVWELIKGFNNDIRFWLESRLREDIDRLNEELRTRKTGTKIAVERTRSIRAKQRRLDTLPTIRIFDYSPTGDNRKRDQLSHAEVIAMGVEFLRNKPLLQKLLMSRFPILLIDESQDTNKDLMEVLLLVQAKNSSRFGLGLLGDTMQRIYADGKLDLGVNLPADWARPRKLINHRCPARIVALINKIREQSDGQIQVARPDALEGSVRLFLAGENSNRDHVETEARIRMAHVTSDQRWTQPRGANILILEHHMAAKRLQFGELYQSLHQVSAFRTGLLDGSLPFLRLFTEQILPVVKAKRNRSEFAVAAVVRKWSPLLSPASLSASGLDQSTQLAAASSAVSALSVLCDTSQECTLLDVLQCVADHNLFEIPEALYPFAEKSTQAMSEPPKPVRLNESDDDPEDPMEAIRQFLQTRFNQIEHYAAYVSGTSAFDTHQGVKGLEFPRVMVVIDDRESRGFMFSYEKLFGAKAKSDADRKNELGGSETGIDRTRRLFYVTCSRASDSLAIVAYTSDVEKVRRFVLDEGWLSNSEVEVIC